MPNIRKERERLPIDKVPGDIVDVVVVQIDPANGVGQKFVLILRADLGDETDQIGVLRFFCTISTQLREQAIEGVTVERIASAGQKGQPIHKI